MRKVKVDYYIGDGGKSVLEEDMARAGRARETSWLVRQISNLTESDIDSDFNGWPLYGKEGQWGSIEIDVYCIMCQVLKPPPYKRRLNAPILLKVAGVGTRSTILRRLEEIEQESQSDDGG
jgi:hypothetical protein